jgi:hypothetical protein
MNQQTIIDAIGRHGKDVLMVEFSKASFKTAIRPSITGRDKTNPGQHQMIGCLQKAVLCRMYSRMSHRCFRTF